MECLTFYNYTQFEKKRITRIAPLYYFALALALILGQTWNENVPLWDIILHITFLNGLHMDAIHSILGVEWYVSDLFLFFFLAPIIRLYVKDLKTSVVGLGLSILIASIFSICINHIYADRLLVDTNFEMYVRTHFIINEMPTLMLGVVFYYLNSFTQGRNNCKEIIAYSLGAITLFCVVYAIARYFGVRMISTSFVIALLFFVIILLVSCYASSLHSSTIEFFGKYSLGIYLLHNLLIMNISGLIDHKLEIHLWLMLYFCIAFASVLIAYIVENAINYCIRSIRQ